MTTTTDSITAMDCPACEAGNGPIGQLGSRLHYRCYLCGCMWSSAPEAPAAPELRKKRTFTITTPAGVFTRTTSSMAYTHACVWTGPRITSDTAWAREKNHTAGVSARYVKDNGHGVTWHLSEASARKAAAGRYKWDAQATCLGVFAAA